MRSYHRLIRFPMEPSRRRDALRLLAGEADDRTGTAGTAVQFTVVREVEAACHSCAHTENDYWDGVLRAAFNLRQNPSVGKGVLWMSDEQLAANTIVSTIEAERVAREERFQQMLQEKYDALNDETFQPIVRCRRCGSAEVSWEEKQVRSADEGATVFCVCTVCKNRWVMR